MRAARVAMMWVAFAACAVSLGACHDPSRAAGTAALVETTFDPALRVEQLAFELRNEAGDVLDQTTLPEKADGALSSPQTIRWLLPDSLAGSNLTVSVQAFAKREPVAEGAATDEIVNGFETLFVVDLAPPGQSNGADGGATDGGADAGGIDTTCGPSNFNACGTSTTCIACDGIRADRCTSGSCKCGTGSPCGTGQHCSGGMCVCDDVSCPTCCEGDQCRDRSLSKCGAMGTTCFACSTERADNCSVTGECKCGTSPICDANQRCSGGSCVCDDKSCPNGCCSSGQCLAGDAQDHCGIGGQACQVCNISSTCFMGSCI